MTDSAQDNRENRRDTRISYDLPVFFYIAVGKRKPREVNYLKGYTQDISKNGIKLLIERPSPETVDKLSTGTEVELEIYLPAVFRSKPISARGSLVWVERSPEDAQDLIAGIDMVNLDDKMRDTLKAVAGTLREVTDDILGDDLPGENAPPAEG